jgi:hypothetical protein
MAFQKACFWGVFTTRPPRQGFSGWLAEGTGAGAESFVHLARNSAHFAVPFEARRTKGWPVQAGLHGHMGKVSWCDLARSFEWDVMIACQSKTQTRKSL